MTPTGLSQVEVQETYQPSYTYKWDEELGRIIGKVDGKEAVYQAVKKILNTQRYSYAIYDGEYGVETERLIGAEYDFIVADLPRVINEALLADSRVVGTKNYVFSRTGLDSLEVSFEVDTVDGELLLTQEVVI